VEREGAMKPEKIDKWGIVQLYVAALKKGSWIEAISLGYTLLEMQLRYLARSKARASAQPLPEARIEKCRYLLEIAALTRDEGFLPQSIFDKVQAFNSARIRAIHKLLTETVTNVELETAARSITPIYKETQDLWLPIRIGPEERVVPEDA
jgi:hypothetical protein